jgi:hypothetical protein
VIVNMVEINVDVSGRGPIIVAGHDISADVSGFTLSGEASKVPKLTLDLTARCGIKTMTGAVVTVTDETRALLESLGWIAPVGD